MNAIQLFVSAIISAGIDANSPELKALLDNPALANIQLSDEAKEAFTNNLFTVESAKNNSDLKSYFHAQALNGFDTTLSRAIDELELDDEVKARLNAEKNSGKRAGLLAKEIRELERAKAGKGTGATKELQDKINALQAEISNIAATHKTELDTLKANHDNILTDMQENAMLGMYKYAGDMPDNVKLKLAKTLVTEEMATKGLTRTKDENGNMVLLKKDGTKLFENNKEVDYKSFVESTLAQNKFLQTSGAGGNNGGTGGNNNSGQGQQQQKTVIPGNGNAPQVNNAALAELEAQIAQASS